MKIQTTVIIVAVATIVAFTGGFYISHNQNNGISYPVPINSPIQISLPHPIFQHIDIKSCKFVTDNGSSPLPADKVNDSLSWIGTITYKLIQNSTTLNMTRGSSLSETIPMCIGINAPMIFYLLEDNDVGTNQSGSNFSSGVSVSMPSPNKQFQSDFMPFYNGSLPSKTSIFPTKVGHMSFPYSISVPNNVHQGTYHLHIFCWSLMSDTSAINLNALQRVGFSFSNATDGFWQKYIDTNDYLFDEGRYYHVTLSIT